jgi:hypothetical protein
MESNDDLLYEVDDVGSVGPFTVDEYELVEDLIEDLASLDDDFSTYVNVIVSKLDRVLRFHALALDMPGKGVLSDGKSIDFTALILELVEANPHDFELRLPTRTIFGKALTDLEISFWSFLSFVVEKAFAKMDTSRNFLVEIEKYLSERIFNRMTAELLVSIATNRNINSKTRHAAIEHLATLWEESTIGVFRDFAPLLDSIWNARKQAKIVMGTMMGIQEMFDMQIHGATHYFLDFFAENSDNVEVNGAFREFLFGATYQELADLENKRRKYGVVSNKESEFSSIGILNGDDNCLRERTLGIYRFFTKRKMESKARLIARAKGPKRTAEEYLLIYFIENNL